MELVRFGRGQGRPRGRVARRSFGSKGKVSEWRNFGVEWLLGAANGNGRSVKSLGTRKAQISVDEQLLGAVNEEPQRRIHTWRLCLKLALNPDPYKNQRGRHSAGQVCPMQLITNSHRVQNRLYGDLRLYVFAFDRCHAPTSLLAPVPEARYTLAQCVSAG